jgi:hypothetical protein
MGLALLDPPEDRKVGFARELYSKLLEQKYIAPPFNPIFRSQCRNKMIHTTG